MKRYNYWKNFVKTGKIDDYLNYIACTREESMEEYDQVMSRKEEGGFRAGVDFSDGDGTISHAGW